MSESFSNHSQNVIIRNFDLEVPDEPLSEEALFQVLADQIAYMIEFRMEYLLSLLYRNDVEESKINFALSPACEDPANIALAKLVMERQRQRLATKKSYKIEKLEDLEEGLEF